MNKPLNVQEALEKLTPVINGRGVDVADPYGSYKANRVIDCSLPKELEAFLYGWLDKNMGNQLVVNYMCDREFTDEQKKKWAELVELYYSPLMEALG